MLISLEEYNSIKGTHAKPLFTLPGHRMDGGVLMFILWPHVCPIYKHCHTFEWVDVKYLALVLDVDDHLDLLFGTDLRREAGDTDLEDVPQAHIQVFGDVVVGAARDEAQLVFIVVYSNGVGVEWVVGLADQVKLGPYLQLFNTPSISPG